MSNYMNNGRSSRNLGPPRFPPSDQGASEITYRQATPEELAALEDRLKKKGEKPGKRPVVAPWPKKKGN